MKRLVLSAWAMMERIICARCLGADVGTSNCLKLKVGVGLERWVEMDGRGSGGQISSLKSVRTSQGLPSVPNSDEVPRDNAVKLTMIGCTSHAHASKRLRACAYQREDFF